MHTLSTSSIVQLLQKVKNDDNYMYKRHHLTQCTELTCHRCSYGDSTDDCLHFLNFWISRHLRPTKNMWHQSILDTITDYLNTLYQVPVCNCYLLSGMSNSVKHSRSVQDYLEVMPGPKDFPKPNFGYSWSKVFTHWMPFLSSKQLDQSLSKGVTKRNQILQMADSWVGWHCSVPVHNGWG